MFSQIATPIGSMRRGSLSRAALSPALRFLLATVGRLLYMPLNNVS
jgi:hypothetical protein